MHNGTLPIIITNLWNTAHFAINNADMLDAAYFVGFKYRVSNAPPSVSLGELYLDANISENNIWESLCRRMHINLEA